MTQARVTSINLNNFKWERKPHGAINIEWEGGNINLKLTPEDAEMLMAAAYKIVAKRRAAMGEAVANVELPPLIGYDGEKTIEPDYNRDMGITNDQR